MTLTDAQLQAALRDPAAILRELDRIDAEESLYAFMRIMWHINDPGQPFVPGWPLEAICEHLEAVTAGEIQHLLINVPPGFSKSMGVDVYWPAWEWGPKNMPHMRYIAASYQQDLTIRDNVRFRRVIMHDAYRLHWGNRFGPSADQFNVIRVANDKTGWKIATSVGGIGTGERGNRFIIDDANSVMEAESEAVIKSTNMWRREVVPDRFVDMAKAVTVDIQQRTNENDCSGMMLSEGFDVVHLMIPMEYDSSRHCVTVIDWEDPRTEDGELAWPERFPREVVEKLKKDKGPYAYAGQYQQMPTPRGGGIIKRNWWQMWPPEGQEERWFRPLRDDAGRALMDEEGRPRVTIKYPEFEYLVASVDTAFKTKEENDYSAMQVWGLFMLEAAPGFQVPKLLMVEAWQARLPFNELVERVMRTCRKRQVDALLIEDKASGQSVVQEVQRIMSSPRWVSEHEEASTWTTIPINPEGDKVARVHSIVPLFSNKMIYAPADDQFRPWAEEVISQVSVFPRGAHDDHVDSCSMALRYLRKINLAQLAAERMADDVAAQSVAGTFGARTEFGDDVGGY